MENTTLEVTTRSAAASATTTTAATDSTDVTIIFILDVLTTGFLCLVGFLGNILCLVALCKERRKNSNIYLLSALAVFDWFMLLFMFNGVVLPGLCKYLRACPAYLNFLRNSIWIIWATGCIIQTATIWMVVAVTFDRFIAVCLPLQTRKTSSGKRAKQLILTVVLFSVLFNMPRFFHYYPLQGHDEERGGGALTQAAGAHNASGEVLSTQVPVAWGTGTPPSDDFTPHGVHTAATPPNGSFSELNSTANRDHGYYTIHLTDTQRNDSLAINTTSDQAVTPPATPVISRPPRRDVLHNNRWYHFIYYITLSWLVQYVIPILTLLVLNVILLRQIRHAQRKRAQLRNKQVIHMQTENISVTINIIAIVTVFIICQTPDFLNTLLSYPALGVDLNFLRYLRAICYCFLALNSSVNFLLYCLFFRRFRRTVLRVFCFIRTSRKSYSGTYDRQLSDTAGGHTNGDPSSQSLTKHTRVDAVL